MISLFETNFKAKFNLCFIIEEVLNQNNPLISLLVSENPFRLLLKTQRGQ